MRSAGAEVVRPLAAQMNANASGKEERSRLVSGVAVTLPRADILTGAPPVKIEIVCGAMSRPLVLQGTDAFVRLDTEAAKCKQQGTYGDGRLGGGTDASAFRTSKRHRSDATRGADAVQGALKLITESNDGGPFQLGKPGLTEDLYQLGEPHLASLA